MKLLTALFLFVVVSCNNLAPVDVGNGGHGVISGDNVYLLDLVEIGQQESKISADDSASAKINFLTTNLRAHLGSKFPVDALVRKLLQIEKIDPVVFYSLYAGILGTQWSFVDRPLNPIPLEDNPQGYQLRPIASRGEHFRIRIDPFCWDRMNQVNKVALVIHEIIYAFLPPLSRNEGTYSYRRQDAKRARELTQLFFRAELPKPGSLAAYIKASELPFTRQSETFLSDGEQEKWRGRVALVGHTIHGRLHVGTVSMEFQTSPERAPVRLYPNEVISDSLLAQICQDQPQISIALGANDPTGSTYELGSSSFLDKQYRVGEYKENLTHKLIERYKIQYSPREKFPFSGPNCEKNSEAFIRKTFSGLLFGEEQEKL